MRERYQGTLDGFRPSANPQPQTSPSDTGYMVMLRGLITAVQADISSVADPQHITQQQIAQAAQLLEGKSSINELKLFDFLAVNAFCTDAGQFYADLQANALETDNTEGFETFGRQMEIAKILQDRLLAEGLKIDAAVRQAMLTPEHKL